MGCGVGVEWGLNGYHLGVFIKGFDKSNLTKCYHEIEIDKKYTIERKSLSKVDP